VTSNVGFLA
jgi:hypothetical protein